MKKSIVFAGLILLVSSGLWAQSFGMTGTFCVVMYEDDAEYTTDTLTVNGYGYDDSRNLRMSQPKANMKAMQMIAMQAAGNEFEYYSGDGVSIFTVETDAVVTGAQIISQKVVGSSGILLISEAETEVKIPSGADVKYVALEHKSEDGGDAVDYRLDTALYELLEEAVQLALDAVHFDGKFIRGMVYITGLDVVFSVP